ncbi:MAG: 4-hydroxythreonine-4-phosphate dehydrogenase PdxA [Spirochaetales bacterium]|jgi:4-hydroxythreonine-4-phosphate dehydrogenase|nr:4-hydroxythreonine-4-phosphate dehydrogenase PdxA [Spirochaetales bacterium]
MNNKPIIGILLGDSAGIGPELVAKTAADGLVASVCRPLIIGDARIFEKALAMIGKTAEHYSVSGVSQADWTRGIPILDQKDQDPAHITIAQVQESCGRAVLSMMRLACDLCKEGAIQGICFAPFNKTALKAAGFHHESEHGFFAELFGVTGPCGELNVLGNLMTTRASSHIPIKDVSSFITTQRVLDALTLSYSTLRRAGIENPRVGVAALNPHCGENGRCGREEIDIIAPAIQKANESGMGALGPFSADTIFIRAFAGDFDCVVTMYHDQGQIAMKLKGFDMGVTVAGGMPYPIATPAHGTAFDIAGRGIAKTSAFESALRLVVKMAENT